MITPMINPMINPIVSQMIQGYQPVTPTRTIVERTVSVGMQQHYTLDSNIIMGADWRLTFDFYSSSTEDKTIFASVDFDNNKVRFGSPSGLVKLIIKGDTNVTLLSDPLLGPLNDMKIHQAVVGVIGGTMFVSIDGGAQETAAAPNNPEPFELGTFLVSRNLAYTAGTSILNVKFEDISGGVNYTFPINTATGNTEDSLEANRVLTYVNYPESQRFLYTVEANRYLGAEILADNELDNSGSWLFGAAWTFGVSEVSANGTQVTDTDVYQIVPNVTGLTYEGIIDVTSISAGAIGPKIAGQSMDKTTIPGIFTSQGTSIGTNRTGAVGDSNFIGTLNSISIRSFLDINF